MRIGIDTLFEHPQVPSSAIDYLVTISEWLPKFAPEDDYDLFISFRNRFRFEHLQRENVHLVNCLVSNEVTSLRILAEQTVLPVQARRRRLDLLFSPGNVCPMAGDFCRVLKINTLHHLHTPERIGWLRSKYRSVAFKKSADRSNLILANSPTTQRELCDLLGVPEAKVALIWEAVDDCYKPVPFEEVESTRLKFGLRKPYVLFVSALYAYKNPEGLLQAMAGLASEGKLLDHDLVFIGRDQKGQQAKLENMSRDLGLKERTHFLGFLPAEVMPALYSGARVFVFPSLIETFGKPLVEAMRCGVPVVASNTTCIPEVAGDAALFVNPNDFKELAGAIYRACSDETLRRDLIERGFRRGQFFSWESHATLVAQAMQTTYLQWKGNKR